MRYVSKKSNHVSFTLYPAHRRMGRWNLVLRHSVPRFLPNLGGFACQVTELHAALCLEPERRNEHINFNKYFISSSEASPTKPFEETTTSHGQSHTLVSLRHDWPHYVTFSLLILFCFIIKLCYIC